MSGKWLNKRNRMSGKIDVKMDKLASLNIRLGTIQTYVDFEYYNLGMMNLYFASLWQDYELPFLFLNMIWN